MQQYALTLRYSRIDALYLNAGIMPAQGVDWAAIFKPSLSHFVNLFNSGAQVMRQHDFPTPDGLQAVFATNIFGHFVLVGIAGLR
jgi:17beta-estradiol 17-dehydrogenase/3beta-hydroxysteroid 3-dehydrogenase